MGNADASTFDGMPVYRCGWCGRWEMFNEEAECDDCLVGVKRGDPTFPWPTFIDLYGKNYSINLAPSLQMIILILLILKLCFARYFFIYFFLTFNGYGEDN
jgi:hypothetical protein